MDNQLKQQNDTPQVPRKSIDVIQNAEVPEEEEKEVRLTPKLEKWATLFLDRTNKETYGNATESAMQAYNCKNRVIAGQIGSRCYKKVKGLASSYMEGRGITFGVMLDVAMAKVYESKNGGGIEWWKEVAVLTGVRERDGAQVLVQNNTQVNNNYDLNAPEVKDFNQKFEKFLNNES